MAKTPPKTPEPEVTQEKATLPIPVDEAGHALDQHGLPINGPARLQRLEELEIEDPALAEATDEQPVLGAPLTPPNDPEQPEGSTGQQE